MEGEIDNLSVQANVRLKYKKYKWAKENVKKVSRFKSVSELFDNCLSDLYDRFNKTSIDALKRNSEELLEREKALAKQRTDNDTLISKLESQQTEERKIDEERIKAKIQETIGYKMIILKVIDKDLAEQKEFVNELIADYKKNKTYDISDMIRWYQKWGEKIREKIPSFSFSVDLPYYCEWKIQTMQEVKEDDKKN